MIPPIAPNEWEPDITPARELSEGHRLRIEHSRDNQETRWWKTTLEEGRAWQTFHHLLQQGYHAFRIYENGGYARRITEFDPEARDILLTRVIGWPPPGGYVPEWNVPGVAQPKPMKPYTITDADLRYLVPSDPWDRK
jgi:hypothetical protein